MEWVVTVLAVVGAAYSTKKLQKGIVQFVNLREIKREIRRYHLTAKIESGSLVCPITGKVLNYQNIGLAYKSPKYPLPIMVFNDASSISQASTYPDKTLYNLMYEQ